jgi:ribonuclease E
MRDEDVDSTQPVSTTTPPATRRRGASRPAGPPAAAVSWSHPQPSTTAAGAEAATPSITVTDEDAAPAAKKAAKRSPKKQTTSETTGLKKSDSPKSGAKAKSGAKKKAGKKSAPVSDDAGAEATDDQVDAGSPPPTSLLFQAPAVSAQPIPDEPGPAGGDDIATEARATPRRRTRGGRGGANTPAKAAVAAEETTPVDASPGERPAAAAEEPSDDTGGREGTSRRRRRRRGGGDSDGGDKDTTPRAKKGSDKSSITLVEGSTRIEAKKQRRREGREAGRRRPPILSESEFLARRESVDRFMVIRQDGDVTQIAVLEDNVLVEHYVNRESQSSMIGNVYLGRVQNVLPSMEAAFIDIGRGRNAVLYAGEVNWDLMGDASAPRKIESALKPGQTVLVQVSKDPVGHKGARLTSQVSLPGRYLVYVPDGTTSGISRKLPDKERTRLKNVLKGIVPEEAGVIIRTAAEGASEEELTRDVSRLTARWEDIEAKVKSGQAPQLLYAEPDTTIKVVRDLFTEDFGKLIVSGDDAWDMVEGYVSHVAPHLMDRLERYAGDGDAFTDHRIDEQIAKALEQKVWLPSGGSLVIDRTEAMTVVDVNTGKFTGSGGNLEETVTKNNLEAAEEIVRQLRLRDIGGIIVIDFIDMVLESNRDLVLRRLVECLARDRTRHQVAEVTSLGLVQMTRKRIGTGLLEAFGEPCEHCHGRGVIVHSEPVEQKRNGGRNESPSRGTDGRRRGSRSGGKEARPNGSSSARPGRSAEPDEAADLGPVPAIPGTELDELDLEPGARSRAGQRDDDHESVEATPAHA